jgi:hypothetical protein
MPKAAHISSIPNKNSKQSYSEPIGRVMVLTVFLVDLYPNINMKLIMKKLLPIIFLCLSQLPTYAQSFTQSKLPILRINTRGNSILDEPKTTAIMEVFDSPSQLNDISKAPTIRTHIGIELRGSTSKDFFPKKPYGFETRDSTGANRNIALLGLPTENDWVLNTVYNDKTLMRDVLAYDLVRRSGRYATRYRYCEVIINNEYLGVYVLMEKVKVDKNRVDIASLKTTENSGDDLTGGYIIKIDKTSGSKSRTWTSNIPPQFGTSSQRVVFQVHQPNAEDITNQQFTYIQKFINDFEAEINSERNYDNPNATYKKRLDLDSFVDYFLITELTRNVDGYRLSNYLHKNKDSKNPRLIAGPAWDYNLGFGNADYYDGWKTTGWVYLLPETPDGQSDFFQQPFWYRRLLRDSAYVNKVGKRWKDLRKGAWANNRIMQWIDSTQTNLAEPRRRDNDKWGVLGRKIWPNYYSSPVYIDEVNWLKDWITQRLAYMDSVLNTYGVVLANEKEEPLDMLVVYPNPVINQEATIKFKVLNKGDVVLQITDSAGRYLDVLVNENLSPGEYSAEWKPANNGIYIVDLQNNGIPTERKKVQVLR